MAEIVCPGLPAEWVNAWLACVGATALEPRLRLRWTQGGTPRAVLSCDATDPIECLVDSWPTRDALDSLPLAENWGETPAVKRKVHVDKFAARAEAARGHSSSWTLSSTMTDLDVSKEGEVAHAPFDPAGPGTTKWLHHRLLKLHEQVDPTVARLRDSCVGTASRVKDNGLGFDLCRMGSQSDRTERWVDPVVEVLAFFGLSLLPVRGKGTDATLANRPATALQRGWFPSGVGRRRLCFEWPAWSSQLDHAAIDALLDAWHGVRAQRRQWEPLGVHAAWRTVRYEPRGSSDTTRGFGAERL